MDEVASLTPTFAGVSYDRLEGYNTLQWPVAKDGTDQPCSISAKRPSRSPTAKPASIRSSMFHPAKSRTPTYDLHLNNGRLLEHFEQGNHDLSRPRHHRDHARSLRRGLARTRQGARPRVRPVRPARKPLRLRPRQGPRHRIASAATRCTCRSTPSTNPSTVSPARTSTAPPTRPPTRNSRST